MSEKDLEILKDRRDDLLARPVWGRREHEEYRRLDGFIQYAERIRARMEEAKNAYPWPC